MFPSGHATAHNLSSTPYQFPPYTPPSTSPSALSHEDVSLWVRQQPLEALVCVDGKEKMRKPVDPPPIIQITVQNGADPMQHYLQSPYLFMCASLWHPVNDEPWRGQPSKTLAGSMVSSLHRLKDIDNKDGAFFVFGDLSVKQRGEFRLRFSLFDYQKTSNAAHFLGSVTSKPFKVEASKDYKGLSESTYLSRAFSDQGVRLRLRKEPRTMMNNKRSYSQVQPEDDGENKRPKPEIVHPQEDLYHGLSQPYPPPLSQPPPPPPPVPQQQPPPQQQLLPQPQHQLSFPHWWGY